LVKIIVEKKMSLKAKPGGLKHNKSDFKED
jgi:hypothetical protein